jgi:hypothetical protein
MAQSIIIGLDLTKSVFRPLAPRPAAIRDLGPIASSAFAATTPEVAAFRSARAQAA